MNSCLACHRQRLSGHLCRCYRTSTKERSAGEDHHMLREDIRAASRRRFLQYCAASPLLASSGFAAQAWEAPSNLPDPMMWAPPGSTDLIKTPKEAINVFDFEPVARQNVPPAHFGYMASGVDDEVTLRAN